MSWPWQVHKRTLAIINPRPAKYDDFSINIYHSHNRSPLHENLPKNACISLVRMKSLVSWNNSVKQTLAGVKTTKTLDQPTVSYEYNKS